MQPVYRLHSIAGGPTVFPRAFINYFLKETPKDPISIAILDQAGNTVKTLFATRQKGINRVMWDLRYDGARQARLRTKPPGNPHLVEEKRFHLTWEREGWYPILSWGTYGGFRGFLAAPGTYTVKLKVGEKEFIQTLEVKKDPRSAGTVEDIKEQLKFQLAIREDLNTCSDMISQVEWMRKQLYTIKDVLKEGGDVEELKAVDSFDAKLCSVEDELFQRILAEGDSKSFRNPLKIYSKLSVLAGDVSNLVDFAPNKQQREVHAVLKERLEVQKKRFDELLKTDLPAFNAKLKEKNIAGVIIPVIK
jgi:hypothetical protein